MTGWIPSLVVLGMVVAEEARAQACTEASVVLSTSAVTAVLVAPDRADQIGKTISRRGSSPSSSRPPRSRRSDPTDHIRPACRS